MTTQQIASAAGSYHGMTVPLPIIIGALVLIAVIAAIRFARRKR
jgi:uncharacterized membrane protein YkvI